jgi:hypothetical protein
MNILYVSSHAILEYDELRLFAGMGHSVFSLGYYFHPTSPRWGVNFRPPIHEYSVAEEMYELFDSLGCSMAPPLDGATITKEFADHFDVIVVMSSLDFMNRNWEAIRHRPIIWRSIGQNLPGVEGALTPFAGKIKIVRASPKESLTPGYAGEDAVIRFYKEPTEWSGWSGEEEIVLTLYSFLKQRTHFCNHEFYEECTRPFDRVLYGHANDDIAWAKGLADAPVVMEAMKKSRLYFCVHTSPAGYTLNFIEAWMTGLPIVTYGSKVTPYSQFYEVPELMQDGITGFLVDSVPHGHEVIRSLLRDRMLATSISHAGRSAAIRLFGRDVAIAAWTEFLGLL